VVVVLGRIVVDEEEVEKEVEVVVVVSSTVVDVLGVVDVDVVNVVEVAAAWIVNASSGTIDQSPSSIFQTSIRQVPPPFSYMNNSSGTLSAFRSSGPDIVQVQP
jgi:hypothetical protein